MFIFWNFLKSPTTSMNEFLHILLTLTFTFMSFWLAKVDDSIPSNFMSLRGTVKKLCFYWMFNTVDIFKLYCTCTASNFSDDITRTFLVEDWRVQGIEIKQKISFFEPEQIFFEPPSKLKKKNLWRVVNDLQGRLF